MVAFRQAGETGAVGDMLAKYGETPTGAINQVAPRALIAMRKHCHYLLKSSST
jgi:hypothetical protein